MTTPADRAIFCVLCDLIAVTDAETPIEERQAATQRLRSIRVRYLSLVWPISRHSSLPDPSGPNADCPPGAGQ